MCFRVAAKPQRADGKAKMASIWAEKVVIVNSEFAKWGFPTKMVNFIYY